MNQGNSHRQSRRINPSWIIYGITGIGIIGLLLWSMLSEIGMNPAREASEDLGPSGFITVKFTTNPYPPLPTGNITLSFMPMNSRRQPVNLDALTYEYGLKGSERVIGSAKAEIMSDGSGMYMGKANFPSIGDWWVRVKITRGNNQAYLQFTFYVKPPQ